MKEYQRITLPFKYANNIENLFKDKKHNPYPIIACRDRKKNFYFLNKDKDYNDNYLASISWRKTEKSNGDHFTINMMSKLPAWSIEKCTFSELGLKSEIISLLNQNDFLNPTYIQMLSIPIILKGFNTIIGGETGCGKTLAYVSPILNYLVNRVNSTKSTLSPSSIILSPSWELCDQINRVLSSLSSSLNINCNLLKEVNDININTDIFVSTPHTMKKALEKCDISINKLKYVVMDESDVLLDKSFSQSMVEILSKLSIQTMKPVDGIAEGSQLILCNATSPEKIEEAFGQFVPIDSFTILKSNDMHNLIPCVSHKFIRSTKHLKSALLVSLLKPKGLNSGSPTIVFCNSVDSLKTVSWILSENEINHVTLYKNLPYETRLENFHSFQNGQSNVLLCTDLGSRGLDTYKAVHVINYEFPQFIADYIHRAGRVGRVGSLGVGKVTNIISSKNEINAVNIIERSVRTGIRLPMIDSSMNCES